MDKVERAVGSVESLSHDAPAEYYGLFSDRQVPAAHGETIGGLGGDQ